MKHVRQFYRKQSIVLSAALAVSTLFCLVLLVQYSTSKSEASSATPFTDDGHAIVSNVVSTSGSCVQNTVTNGGVQFWDVKEGGTYKVTLSGVDDAGNSGTDSTIQVIVKSSDNGNECLTATKVTTGVYEFTITMPANACNTYPILYGTSGCDASTGLFAQDANNSGNKGHLRAATFDETCQVTGADIDCNNPPPPAQAALTACKYYDANANGVFDEGEIQLSGWPMTIDPLDGAIPHLATLCTTGCVTWTSLTPGTYTVTEGTANETNWFASTNTSQSATLAANDTKTVNFGNYCTVPSGGLTLGFWSNKNGQGLTTGGDLCFLTSLNLRNADGTNFDPIPVGYCPNPTSAQISAGKTALKNWLLSANATNMANMLSAQLAAMELNVRHGFVSPAAFDLCSQKTITDLMDSANNSLGSFGFTTSASDPTNRAIQEALKNCLDKLNNGGPVVPASPCPATFAVSCPQQ